MAEDDPILERLVEENQTVQPRFYTPTLPLLLLNGASGIGTGFATELPCTAGWLGSARLRLSQFWLG